jgi:Ca-activated chloride channel homolog
MRSVRFALAVLALLLLAGASLSASAQSGRRPVYGQPAQPDRQPATQSTAPSGARPESPSTAAPVERTTLQAAEKPSSPNAVSHTIDTDDTIKVDTALVTIPATAMDSMGRYVPNLKKSDFKLYEDNVEQEIESFGAVEVPFNVVLLLDTSGSTEFKLREIQQAAIAFTEQLRPEDRVMVVSFDEDVYVDCEFTSDRARLRRAIYTTSPGGSTKLYDAVDLVVTERLSRVQGRKAIVLFTDGKDTSSKLATARSTLARIEESDILVYPIHYDTLDMQMQMPGGPGGRRSGRWPFPAPDPYPNPRRRNPWPFDPLVTQQFPQGGRGGGQNGGGQSGGSQGGGNYGGRLRGETYLRALADRSGGRMFHAESITNLAQAFSSIAEELRHQYTLSYYPTNPASDGAWRRVRVRVTQPGVVVRAKDGYRAGAAPDTKASSPEEKRPTLKRNIAVN